MSVERPSHFGGLLRWYRQRAGLSQNRLARSSAIDPAYVNRIEAAVGGEPLVPRPAVLARLSAALDLSAPERDRFYFAAGRCPPTLAALGRWDPAVGTLAGLLADPRLDDDDRAEFRQVLSVLVDRWRRSVESFDR